MSVRRNTGVIRQQCESRGPGADAKNCEKSKGGKQAVFCLGDSISLPVQQRVKHLFLMFDGKKSITGAERVEYASTTQRG